jgi:serine/threonine protein kinase/tetratricopeptide (TPR) repeat protein
LVVDNPLRGAMMDPDRWERVQALFHDAAALPAAEQRPFLERMSGDDVELVSEVLSLLAEDASGDSLLDRDVAHVAHAVLGSAPGAALPTENFGPYHITAMLGEGGMGVVYLARRDDLGSVAAIKILRDAWLSPARRERFANEQRTLAQLNHPRIARLYDADTLPDGTPWFVMEYVDGSPLTAYCNTHASSIPDRLRLFRDVCDAVQHAHRHLVIHRDLKPSNILVRQDGSVTLLDFGIAKQLVGADAPVDQTRTGLRLMTPAYAAPEQLRGGRVGIHTDVYSLGVVLYELLAGRLPYDLTNLTPNEAERLIVEREPDRPSTVARAMPALPIGTSRLQSASRRAWADLDVLCLTAMHKDPLRRYPSVEALIRDVDHYLSGDPLEAQPDTARYRLGKFVRRNWRPVSAAAAVFSLVVVLVIFYTVRLTTARNEAVAEAARTQRIQRFMLNLFQGGDRETGPADTLRVVTLVDQGVREARSLDREPTVQAELYETLGTIYHQLGKFARSDSLLRASLEQRKKLYGPDHPDVASSLVALAALRDHQAQFEDAEHFAREGLDKTRRTLPPGHPAIARALSTLGKIQEDRGTYPKAIATLEEAVKLQSAQDSITPDLVASLTELANSHFYSAHYDISDSLNRRVLAIDRKLYGDRHPNVANDLINLGAIQDEKGNQREAERYYREALAINRPWYGDAHPEVASDLTMLARVLVPQGRLDEAAQELDQALAIYERAHGKVHPRIAGALNEVGKIALQQGRLDDAEAAFKRMADIYRTVYADKHYLIGIALSNLAGVYQERKQYAQAETIFRDVVRRYADVLAPDHPLVGIAHIRLGRTLVLQRRFAEAERESAAGYQLVTKQPVPPAKWLQFAREDLATAYDSLKQPEKAARYRTELASAASNPTAVAKAK